MDKWHQYPEYHAKLRNEHKNKKEVNGTNQTRKEVNGTNGKTKIYRVDSAVPFALIVNHVYFTPQYRGKKEKAPTKA